MPGMENLAPERTETSKGFCLSPSFWPGSSSSFASASSFWVEDIRGRLVAAVKVKPTGGSYDGKAGRNRQAGIGHFRQASAFAAQDVFHRAIAVGLTASKKINVLLHDCSFRIGRAWLVVLNSRSEIEISKLKVGNRVCN